MKALNIRAEHLQIRRMSLEDVPLVAELDRRSFSLPWSQRAFAHEVTDNTNARCWVAEFVGYRDSEPGNSADQQEESIQTSIESDPLETSPDAILTAAGKSILVGMAVVWLIVDEAHIATIAVEPALRGHGIGRAMMAVILDDARRQGMLSATLEVRRSNLAAQALYRRFGFIEVGMRPKYYKDNNEDALILTVQFDSHLNTGKH